VVDLNKMGPHFYTSGLNICALPAGRERGSESLRVAQVLPLVRTNTNVTAQPLDLKFLSPADLEFN